MFTSLSLIAASSLFSLVHCRDFPINVGPSGMLVYDPPFVNPVQGDTVTFTFHPKNHTVTQTSFDDPCTPAPGGFNSDFQPVASTADDGSVKVSYTALDNKTLWFSCQQTNHCQQGMVFALNPPQPPSDHAFEIFVDKAKALATSSSTTAAAAPSDTPAATSASGTSSAPPPATTSGSPPLTGVTIDVEVGPDGQLIYSPNNVTAKAGDVVTFTFNPKNHTVTQSSFASPCSPLAGGKTSGFQPVSNTTADDDLPTFDFVVQDDTTPVWIYCAQTNHCSSGMVFAINPPTAASGNTFEKFLAAAKATAPTSTGTGAKPTASGKAPTSGAMSGARVQFSLALVLGAVGLCVALF